MPMTSLSRRLSSPCLRSLAAMGLAACLLLPAAAQAAPPSDASVERLLVLTKTEALLQSTLDTVEQQMRPLLLQAAAQAGNQPTPQQQKVLDRLTQVMAQVLREELSWAVMKPMQMQIYRESFTQEEVDGLLAFYQSPTGQAYVAKMPTVMAKSMGLMQQRMPAMMAKLQSAVAAVVEEAKRTQ